MTFGKRLMMLSVAAALVGTTRADPDVRQARGFFERTGTSETHFLVEANPSLARDVGGISVTVSVATLCGKGLRMVVRPDDRTLPPQTGALFGSPELDSGVCTAVLELDAGKDDSDAGAPIAAPRLGLTTFANIGACDGTASCTRGFTVVVDTDDPGHAYSYSVDVNAFHKDVPGGGCGGDGPDSFAVDAMITLATDE